MTNETGYYSPAQYRSMRLMNAVSNAARKRTPFMTPGLTIVAPVRLDERWPIERMISRLRDVVPDFTSFHHTPHVTLHGVLAHDQPPLAVPVREHIVSVVGSIMQEVFADVAPFRLPMALLVHGGGRVHPIPDLVWLASPEGTARIARYSELLNLRLRERLPHIAGHLGKPVGAGDAGVKITLGFIDRSDDFYIGPELAAVLGELHDCRFDFQLDRIQLCEFRSKSLADARPLHVVELQGKPPVPQRRPLRKVVPVNRWTDFRGFSFLMVNPGDAHRPIGAHVQEICCDAWVDPSLALYRALGDALADVNLARDDNAFGFARLPTPSFHVTVWDGVADDSLPLIEEPFRGILASLFQALPDGVLQVPPDIIDAAAFDPVLSPERPMRFRFDGLSTWNNHVLVARLAPTDDCAGQFEALKRRRSELDERYAAWGRLPAEGYTPHVSLGYFLHPDAAARTAEKMEEWNSVFASRAKETSIVFDQVRPYFFTDMATFVRVAEPRERSQGG